MLIELAAIGLAIVSDGARQGEHPALSWPGIIPLVQWEDGRLLARVYDKDLIIDLYDKITCGKAWRKAGHHGDDYTLVLRSEAISMSAPNAKTIAVLGPDGSPLFLGTHERRGNPGYVFSPSFTMGATRWNDDSNNSLYDQILWVFYRYLTTRYAQRTFKTQLMHRIGVPILVSSPLTPRTEGQTWHDYTGALRIYRSYLERLELVLEAIWLGRETEEYRDLTEEMGETPHEILDMARSYVDDAKEDFLEKARSYFLWHDKKNVLSREGPPFTSIRLGPGSTFFELDLVFNDEDVPIEQPVWRLEIFGPTRRHDTSRTSALGAIESSADKDPFLLLEQAHFILGHDEIEPFLDTHAQAPPTIHENLALAKALKMAMPWDQTNAELRG